MIFQEPMTSLNPTFSIGFQLREVLRIHRGMDRQAAHEASVRMIEMIGIGAPERRMNQYPHELSGGLRQRIMIAMALVCRPKLLIADEPTTALDVTIQAQILELLRKLQEDLGMSVLMITHDLGVVAEFCRYVYVMYAGRIVEHARVDDLFGQPVHPYTRGLLASRPKLSQTVEQLPTIPGMVPNPGERPKGCYYVDRCERAGRRCRNELPPLAERAPGHRAACWYPYV
jgi:oligopeptide/dipeptide ABC transporter ATP-binding protein